MYMFFQTSSTQYNALYTIMHARRLLLYIVQCHMRLATIFLLIFSMCVNHHLQLKFVRYGGPEGPFHSTFLTCILTNLHFNFFKLVFWQNCVFSNLHFCNLMILLIFVKVAH